MNGILITEVQDIKRGLLEVQRKTEQLNKRVLQIEEQVRHRPRSGEKETLLSPSLSSMPEVGEGAQRVGDETPTAQRIEEPVPVLVSEKSQPETVRVVPPVLVVPTVAPVAVASTIAESAPAPAGSEAGSFEMRLGTYWFVRIGIAMLLTGLVFLAHYAYQNFVGLIGPAGKVALLYLVSLGLAGIGAWLGRDQGRETLKAYGRVLFSGGLAAVYFTTYAAHHVENLRIISSPLLAGVLLFGWSLVVAWIADRKKAEELAVGAVGLAFYASCITEAGLFTLCSNLILAGLSLTLVARRQWTSLSFGSLIGVYAGYAFWRFHRGGGWNWAGGLEDAIWGYSFLLCYWVMFTAPVLWSRGRDFVAGRNVLFSTTNNALFFLIFTQSLWLDRSDLFWIFALSFGAVLLVCSTLAGSREGEDQSLAASYAGQGIFLVTVGIMAKFSGLTLALLMALESSALAFFAVWRGNRWLRFASILSGFIATLLACFNGLDSILTPVVVGIVLAFNGWWMSRRESSESDAAAINGESVLFVTFPLGIWFLSILRHAPEVWQAPLFAVLALSLGLIAQGIRFREMTLISQLYFVPALGFGIMQGIDRDTGFSWWSPTLVGLLATAACHFWRHPAVCSGRENFARFIEAALSLGVVGLITFWLQSRLDPVAWMIAAALVSLGLTAYGLGTGLRWMAGAAQVLHILALISWTRQLFQTPVDPVASLVLILAGLVYARVSEYFASRVSGDDGARLGDLARFHDGAALVLLLGWTWHSVAREWLGLVWTGLAVGLIGLAWITRRFRALACGSVLLSGAFLSLLIHHGSSDPASMLLIQMGIPLLIGMVLQQLVRRFPDRFVGSENWHRIWIAAVILGFGFFVSRWSTSAMGGRVLETLGFATVGMLIFAGGIGLHERGYRRGGLALLGFAIGRALLVDVWTLSLPYRIVCFLGLGVALLLLGYFYNRFQDRIRQWL